MIKRTLAGVAAALAAVTLAACGSSVPPGVGPFGNDDHIPASECVPVPAGKSISYGMEYVQNPTHTVATLTDVTLRGNHGLVLDQAWAVPTVQLSGVGLGPPPPRWPVVGFRWADRQRAAGARVPHAHGKPDRLNLVLDVSLAPGRTQGRAAGVTVTYRLGGTTYRIPFATALVLTTGRCGG